MYEGRTDVEQGKVLGHENMGVVEAVGDAVGRIKAARGVSMHVAGSNPDRAFGVFGGQP